MAPAAPPHPAPCRVPSRSRLSTSVLKRVRPRVPPLRTLASTPEATPRAPAPPGAAAPRHSRPGSPPSAPVCALGTGSYTVRTRTCKPTPQTHARRRDHTRAHPPGLLPVHPTPSPGTCSPVGLGATADRDSPMEEHSPAAGCPAGAGSPAAASGCPGSILRGGRAGGGSRQLEASGTREEGPSGSEVHTEGRGPDGQAGQCPPPWRPRPPPWRPRPPVVWKVWGARTALPPLPDLRGRPAARPPTLAAGHPGSGSSGLATL